MAIFTEMARARMRSLERGRVEQSEADEKAYRDIQRQALEQGMSDRTFDRQRTVDSDARVRESEFRAQAQEVLAKTQRAEELKRPAAFIKAKHPELSWDAVMAIAGSDDTFERVSVNALKPQVPVRPPRERATVGVAPAPIRTVEKQISDTRADLKERTPRPLGPLATGADSASFRQRNAAAAPLRQRLDSLNTVRDNMAAEQQGQRSPNVDPTASMTEADAWEYWRNQGLTAAQATSKVNARRGRK